MFPRWKLKSPVASKFGTVVFNELKPADIPIQATPIVDCSISINGEGFEFYNRLSIRDYLRSESISEYRLSGLS